MIFMNKNKVKTQLSDKCYWDSTTREIFIEEKATKLSSNQKKLLDLLINARGEKLHSLDIFVNIWEDYDKDYNSRGVRNLVYNIRKKLPSLDIINYHGGFYSLTLYNKGSKNFKDHIFEILDQSSHSVVITDIHQEDNPIIFVNNRFTELFGYTQKEVLGKNCRFLQGNDKEQKEIAQIREAIDKQEEIAVTLRNYDKYGKLILNEIHIAK